MSKNDTDEGSIRTVLVALIVAAITIAVFLLPAPPAEAPSEVELKPEVHFIETAEAKEIEDVPTPQEPQLVAMLVPVCSCESTGAPDNEPQHFESDDVTVIVGRHNPRDVGMCQINLDAHGARLNELGLDAYNRADNITYANLLYREQGLQPWVYSKKCWAGNI